MKQITQKEVLKTIEAKRQSAENAYVRAHKEGRFDDAKKNKDYIDAYQDAYCYLASVEIVPDNKLLDPLCNKCSKTNESCPFHRMGSAYEDCGAYEEIVPEKDLNKMLEKTPITPYVEPKVEPLRNDRFREFEFQNDAKRIIDAKSVKSIAILEAYNGGFDVYVDTYIMKKSDPYTFCKALYDDLVEWWKYWKQN